MTVRKPATLQNIAKLNAKVSDDGRSARFTAIVTTGQSLPFTVQYGQIGILIQAFRSVAGTMRTRLNGAGGSQSGSAVAEGLAQPASVSGLAFARDAATGDTLLWIETEGSGAFPLRLSPEAFATLRDACALHEDAAAAAARDPRAAAE